MVAWNQSWNKYVNEWMWLHSNKTLLTKTDGDQICWASKLRRPVEYVGLAFRWEMIRFLTLAIFPCWRYWRGDFITSWIARLDAIIISVHVARAQSCVRLMDLFIILHYDNDDTCESAMDTSSILKVCWNCHKNSEREKQSQKNKMWSIFRILIIYAFLSTCSFYALLCI